MRRRRSATRGGGDGGAGGGAAAVRAAGEEAARRKAVARREAAAKGLYFIAACSYPGRGPDGGDGLPAAAAEAKDTAAALPAGRSRRLRRPTADRIAKELGKLVGVTGIHLIAHSPPGGDGAPLTEPVAGGYRARKAPWWVELITPLVPKGLKYVLLGYCYSLELGIALHEQAEVPVVICFEDGYRTAPPRSSARVRPGDSVRRHPRRLDLACRHVLSVRERRAPSSPPRASARRRRWC